MRKNFIKRYWPLMALSLSLSACGNGQPSKSDAENIYNSNAKKTYIKVTDLRCDPAEHGSYSCFVAYQRYATEALAKEKNEQLEEKTKVLERKNVDLAVQSKEYTKAIEWLEIAWKKKCNGETVDTSKFPQISHPGYYGPATANRLGTLFDSIFNDGAGTMASDIPLERKDDLFQSELKGLTKSLNLIHEETQFNLEQLKTIEFEIKKIKKGAPQGSIIQNDSAHFTKVDGGWETDAFAEIN